MANVLTVCFVAFIAITSVTATLPTCLNCEICVGTIPLRTGGCQLPSTISGTGFDTCPAVPSTAPKICPCVTSTTIGGLAGFDIYTGASATTGLALGADGAITIGGGSVSDPIVLVAADGSILGVAFDNKIACYPYAVVNTSKKVTQLRGICEGTLLTIDADKIDPNTGKVLAYTAGDIPNVPDLAFPLINRV